jgi:hypothetical protein
MGDGPESAAEMTLATEYHVSREDGGALCDACEVHAKWVLAADFIGPLCAICSDNLAHACTV